jgi:hypothetical protein
MHSGAPLPPITSTYNDERALRDILGHTTSEMSFQYVEGIRQASALAFFEIRPEATSG